MRHSTWYACLCVVFVVSLVSGWAHAQGVPARDAGLRSSLLHDPPRRLATHQRKLFRVWTPVSRQNVAAVRREAAAVVVSARESLAAVQHAAAQCQCAAVQPGRSTVPAVTLPCPTGCSGHGTCALGCTCDPGWGGPACILEVDAATPPAKQITVVVAAGEGTACKKALRKARDELPPGFKDVEVVVAHPTGPREQLGSQRKKMKKEGGKVRRTSDTLGMVLTVALNQVKTPYAVVLTGETKLAHGTSASSIVEAMQSSGLTIAGGMVLSDRGPSGGFALAPACHAVRLKNYTVATTPGHAASWGGCMVCDHTSNSFVVDVKRFIGFSDDAVEAPFAALDVFMRASKMPTASVGTCPGAIQFERLSECKPLSAEQVEHAARQLALNYQISHWDLVDGSSFHGCGFGTKKGKKNQVNGRCRYYKHMRDLFLLDGALRKRKLDYVLTEGAMLSALKFRKLMPWDYDIDIFVYLDDWKQMPYLVDPNGFKKDLRKETDMVWSYVRTDEYSTVFKMRRDVDVDTYFIVINTDKSFKAAGPVVSATFQPYGAAVKQKQPKPADRQQNYNIHWRNVADSTPEQLAATGKSFHSPTADIWLHGRWLGIRRYNFANQYAKYGAGASLLHVTRAMGTGVGGMYEGRYGEKALSYHAHYCDDPDNTGCLDGWVWFQSWEMWYQPSKTIPKT